MATCAIPTVPTGAVLVTTDSPTYADTSRAVFSCTTGYIMTGNPYATCNSGTWSTFPTCSLVSSNSNYVTLNDDSSEVEEVLLYAGVAVCGVLGLLLLTCLLVCCCQLLGCYGEGGLFGQPGQGWWKNCCSCRRRHVRSCRTFPRRYELDEHGRRYHMDDNGQRCYYHHKVQKVTSHAVFPDNSDPPETNRSFSSAVHEILNEKKAREIPGWKPHSNPVRNINTSTK